MENKIKRFLSLTLVLVMLIAMFPANVPAVQAATDFAGKELYLVPNNDWKNHGARFAAYFFGSGDPCWVSMDSVDGVYYSVTVPSGGYTDVIFVRMNPNEGNSWSTTWGTQTNDLSLASAAGNCYTIKTTGWNNNKSTGEWGSVSFTTMYAILPSDWNAPTAHMWKDSSIGTSWPGASMTWKDDSGAYKIWSVKASSEYEKIIFSNNGANQTGDLSVNVDGSVYDYASKKWITPTTEETTLYFENTEGWGTPYAYTFFNIGTNEYVTEWPGAAMTWVEDNIWSVTVPAGYHGIIFNNNNFNNNNGKQTSDLYLTERTSELYVYGSGWGTRKAASIGDTDYMTLTGALAAAKNGETVKVLEGSPNIGEISVKDLQVPVGVTLDLNGQYLCVKNAVGSVIDSSDGKGCLKANGDVKLDADKGYIYLDDSVSGSNEAYSGYRFFKYSFENRGVRADEAKGNVKFGATIYFDNAEAYKLLAVSDVTLTMDLTWEGQETPVSVVFEKAVMEKFANKAYEQVTTGGKDKTTMVLALTVTGLEALDGKTLTVTPNLSSESSRLNVTGEAMTYTPSTQQ